MENPRPRKSVLLPKLTRMGNGLHAYEFVVGSVMARLEVDSEVRPRGG